MKCVVTLLVEILANAVEKILHFIVENISNSILRCFYTGTWFEKKVIKFIFDFLHLFVFRFWLHCTGLGEKLKVTLIIMVHTSILKHLRSY